MTEGPIYLALFRAHTGGAMIVRQYKIRDPKYHQPTRMTVTHEGVWRITAGPLILDLCRTDAAKALRLAKQLGFEITKTVRRADLPVPSVIGCHIEDCPFPAKVGLSGCDGYTAVCRSHDGDLMSSDPLCCTHGLASSPFADRIYAEVR